MEQVKPSKYVFADVPPDHWARNHIETARELGFVKGTGAASFSPDAPLPREQLALLLARVLQLKSSGTLEMPFTDVEQGAYYADAVAALHEHNIVQGIGNERFGVGKISNRAEMAALMNRLKDTIAAWRGEAMNGK